MSDIKASGLLMFVWQRQHLEARFILLRHTSVLTHVPLKNLLFSHENQVASLTDTDLTNNTMHISYLSINGWIKMRYKGQWCYYE